MNAIVVALVATLVLATGCTTWSKTALPPQPHELPDQLRIHLKDGQRLTVLDASVVGDSLFGVVEVPESIRRRRVAVALADIQSMEKNRFNVAATALTIVIILGVAWGLLALATQDATF